VKRACPAAVATRAECDRLRASLRDEKQRRRRAEREADALAADNARLEWRALELLEWVDKLTLENERLQDAEYTRAMGGGK
jgi:hypothetical protein